SLGRSGLFGDDNRAWGRGTNNHPTRPFRSFVARPTVHDHAVVISIQAEWNTYVAERAEFWLGHRCLHDGYQSSASSKTNPSFRARDAAWPRRRHAARRCGNP